MIRRLAALTLLTAGCPTPPGATGAHDDLADEFAEIAAVEHSDRAELAALTVRSADLSARTAEVTRMWLAQTRDYERAQAAHQATLAIGARASAQYETAITEFQRAEQQYRLAALIVVLAAASSTICATSVRTSTFRSRLKAEGVDLRGVDIDHVWPKHLGGIDHPLNYQQLDSSLNRSLGAGVLDKFMTQPLLVVQGLAVSALASLSC